LLQKLLFPKIHRSGLALALIKEDVVVLKTEFTVSSNQPLASEL
jgi:hypothetical protein